MNKIVSFNEVSSLYLDGEGYCANIYSYCKICALLQASGWLYLERCLLAFERC